MEPENFRPRHLARISSRSRLSTVLVVALAAGVVTSCVALAQTDASGESQPHGNTPPLSPQNVAPSESNSSADALDEMLEPKTQRELGFHRLTERERMAVSGFLRGLAGRTALSTAAEAHLRAEGWEPTAVSAVKRARLDKFDIERRWLVVATGVDGTWAVEAPILWNETEGTYWGKPRVLGGLEALMDGTGTTYEFFLAEQKELR